jgi:uncharacterized membrane protein YgcG
MNRFMGILLPSVARGPVAVRCLAALVALVLLVALFGVALLGAWAPVAMAGNTVDVGAKPAVEDIGSCTLEANGRPGGHESESALNIHSGGFVDDGTIKKWVFEGEAGGNGTVSLDIFKPGFATHPVLEKQIASPYDEFQYSTVYVTETIPVTAGQGLGVTVSAGPDSQTQANGASVRCTGESADAESFLALWEAPLTVGQQLVPSREGLGEVSVGEAGIEYDAPVVESVSPESGPAAGGTEVTIKGKHLANASVYFPEVATKVPGQTPTSEDTEVKVITQEAVTGAPAEGSLRTFAGFAKFKYTYIGTPRSRTPEIVIAPVSALTSTSVQLNATVNLEGLPVKHCGFGYGTNGTEEEEEEGEGKGGECLFEPVAGEFIPQPVHTEITGLLPGTTYHYFLGVSTELGARSSSAVSNYKDSFTTLGTGGGGGGGGSGGGGSGSGGGGSSSSGGGGGALTKELGGTVITPASSPLISHLVNTFVAPAPKISKKGLLTFPLSAPGPGTFTALATIAGGAAHTSSARASIAKAKSVRYGATSVKVTQAGAVSLKISPSKAAVALLERKHRLLLHVTLTFTPTSGTATTHVVSVVVR